MQSPVALSVVVPARNAAQTLRRAMESAFAQTAPAVEIIVIDDASTDETAATASSYPAVRVIVLPQSSGAAAARNAGIRAAKGDWIAFLDADDEWLPGKLEKQIALIRSGSGYSMVFCASEEFAPGGRSLGDTFRGRPVDCGPEAWKSLLKTNFVATPTVLAPRALLLRLGGFDEELAVGEDQDMWIRLAMSGPIGYVPEPLVRVHVQPKSLSAYRPADQSRHMIPMIKRHLKELRGSLSRTEAREILGERLGNAGRIALVHGDYLRGAAFLIRAALIGHRPFAGPAAVVKAALAGFFRRVTRGAPRRQTAL